jgi:hypothetical protein
MPAKTIRTLVNGAIHIDSLIKPDASGKCGLTSQAANFPPCFILTGKHDDVVDI